MARHHRLAARSARWSILLLGLAAHGSAQDLAFGPVHQMLPPDVDEAALAVLLDADGDGDLDIYVINSDGLSGHDDLYLNDGFGRFVEAPPRSLPRKSAATEALAGRDVDGDGVGDLVLGDGLFLGTAAGRFVDASLTHVPANWGGDAVALGDVDRDGDLDAVFVRSVFSAVLMINDGTGRFVDETSARLPQNFGRAGALDFVDVDGDGDLDLLMGYEAPWLDRLYLNDGAGIFVEATANLPQAALDTLDLAHGDVDGDGDVDLVLTFPGATGLYLNDGSAHFSDVSAARMPPLPIGGPLRDVALVDLDGDGDLDASGTGGLLLNDGAGSFFDVTLTNRLYLYVSCMAHGDVDADGDVDAFLGRGNFFTFGGEGFLEDSLLLNRGDAHFTDVSRRDLPKESAHSVDEEPRAAFGDVDADGDGDLVVAALARLRLYVNDGTGVFDDRTPAQIPGVMLPNLRDVALVDLDGDGDLDVVFAGGTLNGSGALLNSGAGMFALAPAGALPADQPWEYAVAASDVDGDGDLDLAYARDGPDALLLNDGTGTFLDVSARALPAVAADSRSLAFGDVDGDGDDDLVVGRVGSPTGLHLNDGRGRFVDAPPAFLPPIVGDVRALVLADVDGDGSLDLLLADRLAAVHLLLNRGAGRFVDASATHLPAAPFQATSLAVGDVDEDGDLDLAVGDGAVDRVLLNDGAGRFSVAPRSTLRPLRSPTTDVLLVDVDGDLDLDLYLAKHIHQSSLQRNLARQLAVRRTPRIGQPLTLDLSGPPGSPYVLRGAPVAGAGAGIWRQLAAGTLDGTGRASYERRVPLDPALVGLGYRFQAWVGGLPTNLERMLLTDL